MRTPDGQVKPSVGPAGRLLRSGGAVARVPAFSGGACVITIIFRIVEELLNLYWYAVIIAAIFTTMVSFGILDTRNRLVWSIGDFLYRITEPALRRIRAFMPNFGSLDLEPAGPDPADLRRSDAARADLCGDRHGQPPGAVPLVPRHPDPDRLVGPRQRRASAGPGGLLGKRS